MSNSGGGQHPRSEKAKSAQNMHPPRRESAATNAAAGAMAQRPGGLKTRAYSAPMVPKKNVEGAGSDQTGDQEPEDEIAGDPFFQRYNFPQTEEAPDEASSSSSDTEGPLSPTHITARTPALADTLPSPRSPVASVAVGSSLTSQSWGGSLFPFPRADQYATLVWRQ